MRVTKKKLTIPAALLVAGLGLAPAVSAEPSATVNSITRHGCQVVLNVTVGDAGTYYLSTWDDGNERSDEGFTFGAGETRDISFTLTNQILQGAAGLGIYLNTDAHGAGTYLYTNGSWDFPGSADISAACERTGGIDSGEVPVVDITSTPPTIVEGQAPGSITVSRDIPGYALDVPVLYSGTAVAGDDYVALPATVTIPEGETSVTIPVQALDDHLTEPDRPLVATLGPSDDPVGADLGVFVPGEQTATTIVITDPPYVPPTEPTTTTEPETTTTTEATTTTTEATTTTTEVTTTTTPSVSATGAVPIAANPAYAG